MNQRKRATLYFGLSLSNTNAVSGTTKCVLHAFHAITAFGAEGLQTALVLTGVRGKKLYQSL